MKLPLAIDDQSLERFGQELDDIQKEIKASLGDRDRRYIKRMIAIERSLAVAGRFTIYASLPLLPTGPSFLRRHRRGHGHARPLQDPREHGDRSQRHPRPVGLDERPCDQLGDLGVGQRLPDRPVEARAQREPPYLDQRAREGPRRRLRDLRVSDQQRWRPGHLFQPFYAGLLAVLFEWGIAMHDIDVVALRDGQTKLSDIRPHIAGIARKAAKQILKDYVFWPLLAGPFFFYVLGANAMANVLRNLWSYMIIFCGHFPDGSRVFTEEEIVGETRGGWYLRQILGSCNIEGNALLHVMSGHLSHQIEHHLFPDMPSNRYPEAAPRVRALCERYGIPYNSGSLGRQFGTTVRTILRLALPGTRDLVSA